MPNIIIHLKKKTRGWAPCRNGAGGHPRHLLPPATTKSAHFAHSIIVIIFFQLQKYSTWGWNLNTEYNYKLKNKKAKTKKTHTAWLSSTAP